MCSRYSGACTLSPCSGSEGLKLNPQLYVIDSALLTEESEEQLCQYQKLSDVMHSSNKQARDTGKCG